MFFCLPIRIDQTRDKEIIPIVNLVLITVNILYFYFPKLIFIPNYFIYSMTSYAFVHIGVWHLLVNMWLLWVFGNKVNRRLGNLWYAFVYFGTIIVMGIFLRLILKVNIVGASGAIFAVVAICLMLMPAALIDIVCVAFFPLSLLVSLFSKPKHWIYWFVRWGQFKIKALWGLFIIPVLQIVVIFCGGWNWTNLGHLLGLVCGVGAVLILPKHISMKNQLYPVQLSYDFD